MLGHASGYLKKLSTEKCGRLPPSIMTPYLKGRCSQCCDSWRRWGC